jgi:MFS transporter, putative metabolite:H+ symporter
LSTISFMCISTLSLAMYLYTSELYPTRVRAFGVGASTAWLRIASILGPIVVGNLVGRGGLASVFLLFGCTVLFAAFTMGFFGEETNGLVLEEASP